MMGKTRPLPFLLCLLICFGCLNSALSQVGISGNMYLDTTKWAPVIYLSIIPDLSQLNTMSYENIVDRAEISPDGKFAFNTQYFSSKDEFYRIHISKKDDPPASLIIGGRDHNHFFLVGNRDSKISIHSTKGNQLFNNLSIEGYYPNNSLLEINSIVGLMDTLDYFGSSMNRDFIREAVNERLKEYADTCSNKLIADYALFKAGFNPEDKKNRLAFWFIGIGLILVLTILSFVRIINRKKQNPLADLTIQERKIFALLKEGKSNKEIADECAISISTVKSHVNSVYSKLGVGSRKEVVDF